MSTATSSFVIAQPTDLMPDSDVAFVHATALAHRLRARLVTLHATLDADDLDVRMPDANALLRRWGPSGLEAGPPEVDQQKIVHVACVDMLDTLVTSLTELRPDLLVMGTRQPSGLVRWLYGSASEALSHNTSAPTLFLPIGAEGFVNEGTGAMRLSTLLVPVGSEASALAAVEVAVGLLGRLEVGECEVLLLNVGDGHVLDVLELPEREGVHFRRLQRRGKLEDQLLACADTYDVDLIVMATHGHDGLLDILRGSRTERVVRQAGRAVLAVPMAGAR